MAGESYPPTTGIGVARETEIKLKIADVKAFQRLLTKLGAQPVGNGSGRVREENKMEVADAATLTSIFEGLGMSGWFRYEKFRTTFRLPASKAWARGLLIELDETPIGTFVELEGPAPAIDRAAADLGFSKRDYVLKNYLTLYVEECRRKGEQPVHMLFPAGVSPARLLQ